MKKIIAVCLCLIALCSLPISVYASSIQPCYNNVDRVNTTLTISSSGVATVKNLYIGITGTTKSAKIVTKVQKKVGIIWVTADNGSWTDNSSSNSLTKSHSVQLSGKVLIAPILFLHFPVAAEVMIKSQRHTKVHISNTSFQ